MLADNRDLNPTLFKKGGAFKNRLFPFSVKHIAAKEWIIHRFNDFIDPINAEGKFPMPNHCIGLEHRHRIDHILTIGFQRCIRPLPCVTTIKKQHLIITPIGADRFYQGCGAIKPAKPAIGLRQIRVINHRMGVGKRRSGGNVKMRQKIFANKMRRSPFKIANTVIFRWWPEIKWL